MRPLYKVAASYPRILDGSRAPDYAPVDGQVPMVPLGFIPQVPETFAYWDLDYGLQNEVGLSIAESTCTAMTVGWPADVPYGYNKAGIEELSKIALERCKTGRCAVKTMGRIAEKLGFYSADSGDPSKPGYVGSSECLAVADADGEIWNFNILTGKNNASAIWAAQRMPHGNVIAVANAFTIRKMNMSDKTNFLYSKGVTELAIEKGWWKPEDEESPDIFDFFSSYGYTPGLMGEVLDPPNVESILGYYSGRRMWRIYSWLSPEAGAKLDDTKANLPKTKDPFPSSFPAPKGSVTLTMVRELFRDHYEGTKYDLTKGMAAGPHANPNRVSVASKTVIGQWERAISMYRATWSFINVVHPLGRSVVWFGYDAPHGTCYLPFYGAATVGAPLPFHSHAGTLAKFSFDVAYMPFLMANSFSEANFELLNGVIRKKAAEVEHKADLLLAAAEAELTSPGSEASTAALAGLSERTNSYAAGVVDDWWHLVFDLFIKYGRLVQTFNDTTEDYYAQSYPDWWLQSLDVGYTTWKPTGPIHGVLDVPAPTPKFLARAGVDVVSITSLSVAWLWPMMFFSLGLVADRALRKVSFWRGWQRADQLALEGFYLLQDSQAQPRHQ